MKRKNKRHLLRKYRHQATCRVSLSASGIADGIKYLIRPQGFSGNNAKWTAQFKDEMAHRKRKPWH